MTDICGPLKVWTWEPHTTRRDRSMVFRAKPESEEWPLDIAKFRVQAALKAMHNARIENAKGEVVFDGMRGTVRFPEDVETFWRECGK
jgi:hypothetical protein